MLSKRHMEDISNDYALVINGNLDILSALRHQSIVIIGGTGFIGIWLTGLLTYLNDYYAFDISITLIAKNTQSFRENHPHLASRVDVRLINTDIRYLRELPSPTNWLIHAASNPDNRIHATYPLETMSVIAEGTHAVLRAAERCSHLNKLLYISSGLIYGVQPLDAYSLSEEFAGAPKNASVSSAYAEAKRYAETLCQSARSQLRLPIVIARPFAFMGPYQSLEAPWALNNFIKDASRGNVIRVLGNGETVRSYMYASDMAFWFLSILLQGKSGETYNVGNPEPITLKALAEIVAQEFGNSCTIQLNSSRLHSTQESRFVPNVSFAKCLGLTLKIDHLTAIKKTVAWTKAALLENINEKNE